MKKYVLSIPDAINDRITKAHKQGKFSALPTSQFMKQLITMGLEEYDAQYKVEQARRGIRLQVAGYKTAPEVIQRMETKIIPFPGVSLSDMDSFQDGLDNFLHEIGYIE
jgi:hypothetical protein